MVHQLRTDDPDEHFQILKTAREHFSTGGPQRVRHTLPPLAFSALQVRTRRWLLFVTDFCLVTPKIAITVRTTPVYWPLCSLLLTSLKPDSCRRKSLRRHPASCEFAFFFLQLTQHSGVVRCSQVGACVYKYADIAYEILITNQEGMYDDACVAGTSDMAAILQQSVAQYADLQCQYVCITFQNANTGITACIHLYYYSLTRLS